MAHPPTYLERTWVVHDTDDSSIQELSRALDIHPLIARVLLQRGVDTADEAERFLHPHLRHMHDPFLMKGMSEAVQIVLRALGEGQRIVIHGDYDVDGISSTSVMYEFLHDIGAQVSTFIPRRNKEGYGLSIDTVRRLQHEGAELLITCDCGISNVAEIQVAKQLGLDVIIVDHHTVPDVVPPADAILNPHQPGCAFPFKQLAAVGVAFNFVVGLRKTLRDQGVFHVVEEPDLRNYLDLV
ncbi:MAG: DHH family phosphoesterase, partial [Myxococcota bacterium]